MAMSRHRRRVDPGLGGGPSGGSVPSNLASSILNRAASKESAGMRKTSLMPLTARLIFASVYDSERINFGFTRAHVRPLAPRLVHAPSTLLMGIRLRRTP